MSSSPTRLRRQHARLLEAPSPPSPRSPAAAPTHSLWDQLLDLLGIFPQFPLPSLPSGAPEPKAAPKKRGRPPGSKNKPKPPATVPADPGAGGEPLPPAPVAPEPEQQPQQPEQLRRPVHLTPAQMRRARQISRQNRFEQLAVACSMDV